MKSRRTARFRRELLALLLEAQRAARKAFRLWLSNPAHPGLQFKKIEGREDLWSARVTDNYRALALREGTEFCWFWIGTHADYDKLLNG